MNEFLNQILDDNKNLTAEYKEQIKYAVNYIDAFLINNFNVGISVENCAMLLINLKITEVEKDTEKAYNYNFETNTLEKNTKIKYDTRMVYDYCMSIFDIITKKYDKETNSYSDGLIYVDELNNTFGNKINEKLKHQLVTCEVIDEEKVKDFYVDKADDPCTLEDALLIDINSMISSEELVYDFINADGISFYQEINKRLKEDEEKTKSFLDNIDKYTKENSIDSRKKYDELITRMKEYIVEDTNKMNIA